MFMNCWRLLQTALLIGFLTTLAAESPCAAQSNVADGATDYDALSVSLGDLKPNIAKNLAEGWRDSDVGVSDSTAAELLRDVTGVSGLDSVCSKRFLPTLNKMILVASIRDSGRFCNLFVVVEKDRDRLVVGRLPAWDVQSVTDVIYKVEDGTLFAIWEPWSDYQGVRDCMAFSPKLYSFSDGKFRDVSRSVTGFYQNMLKMAASTSTSDFQSSCKVMEISKIERALNPANREEIDLAMSWSISPNANLRLKAVVLFGDIGGLAGKTGLIALEQDKSLDVASQAAQEIARLR